MVRKIYGNFLFLCLVLLFIFPAQASASVFLPWGVQENRDDCPDAPTFLWVQEAQGSDCIRYFSSGDLDHAPVVIVHLTGDRDGLLKRAPEDIRNNTRESREGLARRWSQQAGGIPLVLLSRPGIYGSSGDHRQRRQLREFLAINAALDLLVKRYAIGRYVLSGHSGGATAAAAVLTLGRTDVQCAVLTSGAYDLLERARRRAVAKDRTYTPGRDSTGFMNPYDPLDHVKGIARDPERIIYVVGDPRDKNTPFDLQRNFAEAVAKEGHRVVLLQREGRPKSYHDLRDDAGLKISTHCANESLPAIRN